MRPRINDTRRHFMFFAAAAGTGLLAPRSSAAMLQKKQEEKTEIEVTAVEDLMREHGVLRRALQVYAETAPRLRLDASAVDPEALQRTALLFRAFGEDYHEKKLEEAHIFPAIRKAGGPAAIYPDILTAQHRRGREITDYILAVTKGARIGTTHAAPLATTMESFVQMYQNHAAREDTIVFPAWKLTMSPRQLDKMGDLFEEIEKQQFGTDGYEHAVQQIGDIEGRLGLADLAQFTAPPPPKV
jgi:hemerythrin-like domain-containing protein